MPFDSPLSEVENLCADYSDDHHATHPESTLSHAERLIKVTQVMNIAKDPRTGLDLHAEEIPMNVIESRVGNDVNVESFTFKPTATELFARMTVFLDAFTAVIQRYQLETDHYLIQTRQALHFAFGGVTQPGTKETFFKSKRLDANPLSAWYRGAEWKKLVHYCQVFLDKVQPSMTFKEIKMNPDGHVVLRMTIEQADSFLDFRNTWQALFSENYARYDDPEKITTLACVLGVVDKFSLSKAQQTAFDTDMTALFAEFTASMHSKAYPFNVMEISESSNRMLQQQDMYGKLTIQRGYVRLAEHALKDNTPIDVQYKRKYLTFGGMFPPAMAGALVVYKSPESEQQKISVCRG